MDTFNLQRLAHQFMINAVQVGRGDRTWIEYESPEGIPLAEACAKRVRASGGIPFMVDSSSGFINNVIKEMDKDRLYIHGQILFDRMRTMQAYIRIIDDADNAKVTLTDDMKSLYRLARRPMTDYRVNHLRWLVVAAPTEEFAQECGMSLAEFERFYLNVCLVNYGLMTEAVMPLQKIMAEGKTVRIFSPAQETDLGFSIEGITARPCTGIRNIPDGECFTAPVKDTINGTIKFGPSKYDGQSFAFIKLTFKDGKAIEAAAENTERTAILNKMLDADQGARFIGEFAISFNPNIYHPTGNILFDEKTNGGIHLALGKCYDAVPNGNDSVIHWDMVHIQRADYGGGEIWIDERLIRKDGVFVVPELLALNPENLKAASASRPGDPAGPFVFADTKNL